MINTEISPDVAALVAALTACSPGAQISYAALSETIGRDITTCRWLVESARHIAAREHGAVFANIRGAGYARLTTDQLAGVGATARSRIRHTARKAAKLITRGAEKANDVAPETQRRLNAEISALALVEHIADDKAAKPAAVHDTRPEPVALMARRLFAAPS